MAKKCRTQVHDFSLGLLKWLCTRTGFTWEPHVPEETFGSELDVQYPPHNYSTEAVCSLILTLCHCLLCFLFNENYV